MADQFAKSQHGAVSRGRVWTFEPELLHVATEPTDPWFNPRNTMKPEPDFVEDIIARGVVEPVIVVRDGELEDGTPRYVVEDGNQRVLAARAANIELAKAGKPLLTVDGKIRKGTTEEIMLEQQALNAFRRNSPPLVQAQEAQRLAALGSPQREIGRVMRIAQSHVHKLLSVGDCDDAVKKALEAETISLEAAFKLSSLSRADQKAQLKELLANAGTKKVKATEVKAGEEKPPRHKARPARDLVALSIAMNDKPTEHSPFQKGFAACLAWATGSGDITKKQLGFEQEDELPIRLTSKKPKPEKKDKPAKAKKGESK